MIEIIKNNINVDYENIVTRVKAVIINSKNELLLGYSYYEYQFPGGHVEGGEDLNFALKRELKEETGLDYDTTYLVPFCVLKKYVEDTNTLIQIYYYKINDDRIPNLKNTNYTEEEKDGNYKLRYIPLSIVKDVLKDNKVINGDLEVIADEMLDVLNLELTV